MMKLLGALAPKFQRLAMSVNVQWPEMPAPKPPLFVSRGLGYTAAQVMQKSCPEPYTVSESPLFPSSQNSPACSKVLCLTWRDPQVTSKLPPLEKAYPMRWNRWIKGAVGTQVAAALL